MFGVSVFIGKANAMCCLCIVDGQVLRLVLYGKAAYSVPLGLPVHLYIRLFVLYECLFSNVRIFVVLEKQSIIYIYILYIYIYYPTLM